MSSKKIIIDARNRPSSTGRYTDRLLEHLQKIDSENQYTVLLSPTDAWRPNANNFKAVPCRYKQFSINPLEQFGFAGQLYGLRPDLVHFTMTQQPLLYFGKIVTTTHDLTMLRFTRAGKYPKMFHAFRMALYRFMFWWSHRKSNKIIVPSNYVAEDLTKLQSFTSKMTKVTYEASEPPIKEKAKKPSGITKPFILHVGSPFPHKNIERLVKAFEVVLESNTKLKLVLTGKPELYFAKLAKLIEKSPAKNNIVTPGFVSSEELKWLYQNAEAYVLPSLSEGFGLPGLEAMAHGCPLVSSNATCLPEIYDNAALYFNPKDIEDMALKIERVVRDNQLRKELVTKGEAQIKKYSWDKMAEQTLGVYNSVLNR